MALANADSWPLFFQALATLCAVVTVILAWRAIFGPKLRLTLFDTKGDLTRYGHSADAPPAYFYHLRVSNKRKKTANNVVLKIKKISKLNIDGRFPDGELPTPLRLRWAHPGSDPCSTDIVGNDSESGNLGLIVTGEGMFKLDLCTKPWPPNFQGYLRGGERMQVEVVAVADNATSNPLRIDVSWDGAWSSEPAEMSKHLRIQEVRRKKHDPSTKRKSSLFSLLKIFSAPLR